MRLLAQQSRAMATRTISLILRHLPMPIVEVVMDYLLPSLWTPESIIDSGCTELYQRISIASLTLCLHDACIRENESQIRVIVPLLRGSHDYARILGSMLDNAYLHD